MESQVVKVKALEHFDPTLGLPFYASEGAAGADIKACFVDKKNRVIKPGERVLVPTGLAMEIPFGFELQVRPRSGVSLKTPLMVVNAPGTIDSDYRGEICVIIGNMGRDEFVIEHGLRIAQLVLCPVWQAQFKMETELSLTQRGEGGFGSTGKK